MLHEPRYGSSQRRPSVLSQAVFNTLSELENRFLWRVQLGKIISVQHHGLPSVAVEIVHRTPGTNEQISFIAQRPQSRSDLHMHMRVVECVHADYRRGRTAIWEHADENQKRIMDPVEFLVQSFHACQMPSAQEDLMNSDSLALKPPAFSISRHR